MEVRPTLLSLRQIAHVILHDDYTGPPADLPSEPCPQYNSFRSYILLANILEVKKFAVFFSEKAFLKELF